MFSLWWSASDIGNPLAKRDSLTGPGVQWKVLTERIYNPPSSPNQSSKFLYSTLQVLCKPDLLFNLNFLKIQLQVTPHSDIRSSDCLLIYHFNFQSHPTSTSLLVNETTEKSMSSFLMNQKNRKIEPMNLMDQKWCSFNPSVLVLSCVMKSYRGSIFITTSNSKIGTEQGGSHINCISKLNSNNQPNL